MKSEVGKLFIYFTDLKPEVQKKILEFYELEKVTDMPRRGFGRVKCERMDETPVCIYTNSEVILKNLVS